MMTHPYLEQGLAILQARLSSPRGALERRRHLPPATSPFVTVSRESGAGGSTLGRLLLPLLDEKLGGDGQPWMLLDRNLLSHALTQHRLPEHLARYLPEDRTSEIKATIGELLGLHPSLWQLEHQVAESILQLAHVGRVVFAGRAAHLITRSLAGGFHVRLVASAESRTRRLMQHRQWARDEAAAAIMQTDAARRRFVKTNFAADIDDPHTYDLVINTDRLSLATAAHLVVAGLCDRLATATARIPSDQPTVPGPRG